MNCKLSLRRQKRNSARLLLATIEDAKTFKEVSFPKLKEAAAEIAEGMGKIAEGRRILREKDMEQP